jgi:hypothetical protein
MNNGSSGWFINFITKDWHPHVQIGYVNITYDNDINVSEVIYRPIVQR